jgi:hypothetical protein
LIIHRIKRIICHSVERDQNSSAECISDTENWLYWNGDLDNPNHSKHDWEADNTSDLELHNGIEDSDTLEQRM